MSAREATGRTPKVSLRVFREELEWFFGYAEKALRLQRVAMLPSHAAEGTRASEVPRRADLLARSIRQCLDALTNPHSVVLRATFTPRRWPRALESTFNHLAPIAVRLFCTSHPWPGRLAHQGLEEASAVQLASSLGDMAVEPIRTQAEGIFERAMTAYAAQRALGARDAR